MKIQEIKDFDNLQLRMPFLPFFAQSFIEYKLSKKLSPSSLFEYTRDFEVFFTWVLKDVTEEFENIQQIDIKHLEQLTVEDIYDYQAYLQANGQMERTVNRKVSSVRSLFSYLHDIAEDDNAQPLLNQNIFRKITVNRVSINVDSVHSFHQKLLTENEVNEFLDFIRERFKDENEENPQAVWFYNRNRVRDISIVSLMLKSGLLVSDIVNLNVKDISEQRNILISNRKRSGFQSSHSVYMSDDTMDDLNQYLAIRATAYNPVTSETALFLSIPNGQNAGKRMSQRGIQAMVIKYARSYGKPDLTTRQLRHSFGLEHSRQRNMIQTKEQLALKTIEATEKYQVLRNMFYTD